VLLALEGSVTFAGGVTLALLTSNPVAVAATVPLSVKVTVPFAAMSISVFRSPAPIAALQLEPALALHVQVAPVIALGNVSITRAPFAALGPAFLTVIVYVIGDPGIATSVPSSLVMLKSAMLEPSEVVAVALELIAFGSGVSLLTLAVFSIGSGPSLSVK
jgi:hypothetical protein